MRKPPALAPGLFTVLVIIVGIAGWIVARTGESIADRTGLSETVVGGLLTAISTSLPELVTSIAAVRRGALTLAVSGIIGGNAFDTLFVAISDVAYREGSIYHAITSQQMFLMALTTLLIGILLMGLLRREERGIANIGFESFAILVLYIGAIVLLFV
jgi:cation:H+ antiporter